MEVPILLLIRSAFLEHGPQLGHIYESWDGITYGSYMDDTSCTNNNFCLADVQKLINSVNLRFSKMRLTFDEKLLGNVKELLKIFLENNEGYNFVKL